MGKIPVRKIFYNGNIITMEEKQPSVEAVGIEGEKIFAVGMLEEVKKVFGSDYDLIDLKGNTLLPGFIDSHLHPIAFLFSLLNLDLSKIKSLEELQELLKATAEKKSEGELIIGLKLNEEMFDVPILPTRWDLDTVCPKNPVFISRYDGHIGIGNTKALELVGITAETEVLDHGEIRKNEEGELTGVIGENALVNIFPEIIKKMMPKPEILQEVAQNGFLILAQKGITSLHGIFSLELETPLYRLIQNDILQNWYGIIITPKPKKLRRLKKAPLDGGKEDSKFKIGGWKGFLDGTLGAKTAYMFEPYSDAPDMSGFCVTDEDDIYNQMKLAHEKEFQIAIHTIGDKGNRICVDLYKRLLEEFPRENHRHRIEHASMLTSDVIRDIKKYKLIVSSQPPFINSEYTWLEKRIGKERCKYIYPFRSITQSGVTLVSGSDCPVEDPDIILGLHALVTRNGFVPEECLTMEEALKTYTINGAYAAFEENIKGSIKVGKLADIVILDRNPLEIPDEEIKDIKVVETIVRGKSVYKRLGKDTY